MLDPTSFLLITLDSCRYDTFVAAKAPNLKAVGPLHEAAAPGNFTFSSYAAMFMGFTPGVAGVREPYVNPKYGKIFRMTGAASPGAGRHFVTLSGRNVIDGLKALGYVALGAGAAGWFNPQKPSSHILTQDFDRFLYPGNTYSLRQQLDFLLEQLERYRSRPMFLFLNVGETHVPYYHEDAPWGRSPNPCAPFGEDNDTDECRRRQQGCLEWVDARLEDLLARFAAANVIICADHGDAWGEDGLWEHGIHHPTVLQVPLLFRLTNPPPNPARRRRWMWLA